MPTTRSGRAAGLLVLVTSGAALLFLPGTASASTGNAEPPACTITGTAGRDILRGTDGNDVICGLGGNDVLLGLGGNDVLIGGGGRDLLIGGPGDDELYGNGGNDVLLGQDGNDLLVGGYGDDLLVDSSGATREDGGPGAHDRCLAVTATSTTGCEISLPR